MFHRFVSSKFFRETARTIVPSAAITLVTLTLSSGAGVTACSSSSTTSSAPVTCATPGAAITGQADMHCAGMPAQPVSEASCHVEDAGAPVSTPDAGAVDASAADAGPAPADCDYGATMYNQEGDDDDCKYHVKWTSTDLCEGQNGATFTVTVTSKVDGTPVSGVPGGLIIETFQPPSVNVACDDMSTVPGKNTGAYLPETAPGSGVYSGPIVFQVGGLWTVRFHIHEECADILDDSPHGHAAFHLQIP